VNGVTYHPNGGYIALQQRIDWLARWKAALSLPAGAEVHGTAWVQQSLNKLGTEPPLILDGSYGPMTVAAVKEFQQAHGLTVDGKMGSATQAAIFAALAAA